jgi:redox-sensitive bicupin YhaK (pirin superfamily)
MFIRWTILISVISSALDTFPLFILTRGNAGHTLAYQVAFSRKQIGINRVPAHSGSDAMLRFIDSKKMGRSVSDWLDSHFHFSFAEYYNPDNIRFGALRVVNDDQIQPGKGFGVHPHQDMEILSYVVEGELTHSDSMGSRQTLTRGQVQYMSAGTGVTHSEYNLGSGLLRFLQIWILPDRKGYAPNYGDYRFALEDRIDKWLPVASGMENAQSAAPVRIHQDVNVYAAILSAGKETSFQVKRGRQAYLVMIEGSALISGIRLSIRDALEIAEEDIVISPQEPAHIIVFETARDCGTW